MMMNSIFFVNSAFVFFILALLFSVLSVIFKKKYIMLLFNSVLLAASICLALALLKRWTENGYIPLTNLYETFIVFTFFFATAYFFIFRKLNNEWLNFTAAVMAILMLGYATAFTDASFKPLMPALKSNWLSIHVLSYMFSYSLIAVSFVISIVVCIQYILKRGEFSNNASINKNCLSAYNYKIIIIAFPLLNLGLITGSIWAKQAWGDYWSWDPKETWALICWLFYLIYLHFKISFKKLFPKISDKNFALIESLFLICGFYLILYTYFGLKSQTSMHTFYK